MDRPKNWYDMTDTERRAWQQQKSAYDDMEYDRQRAQETAEQAQRDARRAREAANAAREAANAARAEYESNAESDREDAEELRDELRAVKLDRGALLAVCESLLAAEAEGQTGGLPHALILACRDAVASKR